MSPGDENQPPKRRLGARQVGMLVALAGCQPATLADLVALRVVRVDKPDSQRKLAHRANRILMSLMARGYVSRHRTPGKNDSHWQLTPAGAAKLLDIHKQHQERKYRVNKRLLR